MKALRGLESESADWVFEEDDETPRADEALFPALMKACEFRIRGWRSCGALSQIRQ